MTASAVPLQDCRHKEPASGDGEAIAEYQRFNREEVERGEAAGWRFEVGWFQRAGGLQWAWFSRGVGDE